MSSHEPATGRVAHGLRRLSAGRPVAVLAIALLPGCTHGGPDPAPTTPSGPDIALPSGTATGVAVTGTCVTLTARDDQRAVLSARVPDGMSAAAPDTMTSRPEIRLQRGHNYSDGSDPSLAIVEVAERDATGLAYATMAAKASSRLLVEGNGVAAAFPRLPGATVTTWDPVAPQAQPPDQGILTIWAVPVRHSYFTVTLYSPRSTAPSLAQQMAASMKPGGC